jgi:hypothetical protein
VTVFEPLVPLQLVVAAPLMRSVAPARFFGPGVTVTVTPVTVDELPVPPR